MRQLASAVALKMPPVPIGASLRMYHGKMELDEAQTLNALVADADCDADEYEVTIVIDGASKESALEHNCREIARLLACEKSQVSSFVRRMCGWVATLMQMFIAKQKCLL